MTILEIKNLSKYFEENGGFINSLLGNVSHIQAVDDVSFKIDEKESIGVIGESGCGKSTLIRTLMGLHEPTDGEVTFKGDGFSNFDKKDWKEYRRSVQMIFQDPFNSLDPKMTCRRSLYEPLHIHNMDNKEERIYDALDQVELQPPEQYLDKKPHQLSGGEKQRVSIARSLVIDPDILLADEPVSMLDVSNQASILNLLSDLRKEKDLSMLYISHDLSTVSYVCETLKVMYLGRVVESGPVNEVISDPQHPYTQALVNAIPILDPSVSRERTNMEGAPQDPIDIGDGCRFRDRCPERMDICEKNPRTVTVKPDDGEKRNVACHLHYDHERTNSETRDSTAR